MDFRQIFAYRTPEEKFWRWFLANSHRILRTRTGPMELNRAIDRYERHLVWHVDTEPVTERKCLTFGVPFSRPEKVAAVQRLVAAAPKMDEWRFQAFRPPKPLAPVTYGDVTLAPEDIFFSVRDDRPGEKLGICFYVTGLDRKDPHSPHGEATFKMLLDLLGELDAVTKVRIVDFHSLAEIDGNQRPLRDLPLLLDGNP